jgi:hypothetical protein
MKNKLGQYIQKLMTTVIDTEEDEFVRQLTWTELKRINKDISEFLLKNEVDEDIKTEEKDPNQTELLLD